jgi:cell division transport system ATP-binding protein
MWDKKNYIIELKQISVYQKKTLILDNVNLQIRPGEFVYLLGPTGAGKSSLLKLLYGELPLMEGKGRVFDFELEKLDELSLPILRRRLGIISNEYPLLDHYRIEENLEIILRAIQWQDLSQREARLSQVIELLKLSSKRFNYPAELTKTERQRAIIARALLNQPSLLIVDEPTSGLDTESREDILSFIYSFAQATNTAVLFATNDQSIPEQYPGRILRCGSAKVNTIQHLPPGNKK